LQTIRTAYSIPYYAQIASPELAQAIFSGSMPAADDPRWAESGAETLEEYAYWSDRACGVACVKMVVEAFGGEVRPLVEWARSGSALGGYLNEIRPDGSRAERGWLHSALAKLITDEGFYAEACSAELADIPGLLDEKYVLIASVSYQIGTHLPVTRRGGHLVVVSGADLDDGGRLSALILHNPSGRTEQLRVNACVPVARFAAAYTGRIIAARP
jgi:hypothetical protein